MAKAPRFDGLTADMPLAAGARVAIAQLYASVLALAPGVLEGEDTRAVHDMRVAIRRLRAALKTFAAVLPRRRTRIAGRAVARVGRKLGVVRDADVHLAVLRTALGGALAPERAGIAFALETLRERRRGALADFAIELSQFDRDALPAIVAADA